MNKEEMLWQGLDIICEGSYKSFIEELHPESVIADALSVRNMRLYSMGLPCTEQWSGKKFKAYTDEITQVFKVARTLDFEKIAAEVGTNDNELAKLCRKHQATFEMGLWYAGPLEGVMSLTTLQYYHCFQQSLQNEEIPPFISPLDIPKNICNNKPTLAELNEALERQGKLHCSKQNIDRRFRHTMSLIQLELSRRSIVDIVMLVQVQPSMVDEAEKLMALTQEIWGADDLMSKILITCLLQKHFSELEVSEPSPLRREVSQTFAKDASRRVDSTKMLVEDFAKIYNTYNYHPSDYFAFLEAELLSESVANVNIDTGPTQYEEMERHLTKLTSLQDKLSEAIRHWEFNGTGPARKAYRRTFQPFRNALRGGLIIDGERRTPSVAKSDNEAALLTDVLCYLYDLAQTVSLMSAQEVIEPVFTLQKETCAVKQKLLTFCKESNITCNPKNLEAPCDSIALLQDTTTWPALKRIVALRWPEGDKALSVANTLEQLLFYSPLKE